MKTLESNLQQGCFAWFNLQYPQYYGLLFAIPNGGHRHIVTALRIRAEGAISGVADLILLVPTNKYHGLCIEMKYGKGKQSQNQKEWQTKVEKQGYKYSVCNSLDSFVKEINTYLYAI